MSGHEIDGRTVLTLGTWEVRAYHACRRNPVGRVIGRVNAIDAERAVRRAAKKWGVPANELTAFAVLPTVYAATRDGSNGQDVADAN